MPAGNPMGYLTGAGTDASGLGVPEKAMPGAAGDLDSLLLQLQSGQLSAEALLPLLMMLAQGGGGMGDPMAGGAPMGPPPGAMGPDPALGGSPIDEAFGGGGAPMGPDPMAGGMGGPPGGEQIPPELMAMLAGGGF